MKKIATVETVELAESWGREMAREFMTKEAIAREAKGAARAMGQAAYFWRTFKGPAQEAAREAKRMWDTAGPGKRALVGAAAGGLAGNLTADSYNEYGYPKSKKKETLLGAAAGAAAGGLSHPAGRQWAKSKVDEAASQFKKTAAPGVMGAIRGIGEMAQLGAGQLARGALRSTPAQRVAVGAAGGAMRGLYSHATAKKDPVTGQRQGSLAGRMLKNVGAGAAIGASSNALTKQVVKARNPVGSWVRGGMRAAKGYSPQRAAQGAAVTAPKLLTA